MKEVEFQKTFEFEKSDEDPRNFYITELTGRRSNDEGALSNGNWLKEGTPEYENADFCEVMKICRVYALGLR